MAIGLRFMTSKVMERVPVLDWKVGWEVSLRECYPLTALDNLVSTYDKWYNLYKSMWKTITVDQANIALTRKQFSEQLISALADYGDMPADSEALLLSKFEKVFTHFHNPRKDYGSNRLFQNDLKEALEKDAAYTAKPSLQGLLTATQLVMNSWEKDAFRQRQRAELGVDTKRKGESTSTIPIKRTRADPPSIPDKATVGEHCQGCGRPRHTRDECRSRDIPGWNAEGRWIDSKAYKAADAINVANGNGARHPVLVRHQPAAATKPRDSSKQDCKYGPADKNSKFKTTRFSDHVDKHRRGNRGHGGNILPAYSLLHITCNCDDTDIDTMYRTCCITTGNSPTTLSVTTLFE